MKLSVISSSDDIDDIVLQISAFANTQNKIQRQMPIRILCNKEIQQIGRQSYNSIFEKKAEWLLIMRSHSAFIFGSFSLAAKERRRVVPPISPTSNRSAPVFSAWPQSSLRWIPPVNMTMYLTAIIIIKCLTKCCTNCYNPNSELCNAKIMLCFFIFIKKSTQNYCICC